MTHHCIPRRALPDASGRARQGFTLVELLVVIGIIAVLIAILLPALQKARQQANDVVCRSNLQQMAQATRMYTLDFKDVYPDEKAMGKGLFRRGAGEIGLSNPFAQGGSFVPSTKEEVWGLPALFARLKYIKGTGLSSRDVKAEEDASGPAEGTSMVAHGSKVWVCPASLQEMQDYWNTYSWASPGTVYARKTSIHRAKRSNSIRNASTTLWISDNYQLFPAPTGDPEESHKVMSGLSTGTLNTFPHRYDASTIPATNGNTYRAHQKKAVQTLFFDGHVGYSVYYFSVVPRSAGVDAARD